MKERVVVVVDTVVVEVLVVVLDWTGEDVSDEDEEREEDEDKECSSHDRGASSQELTNHKPASLSRASQSERR